MRNALYRTLDILKRLNEGQRLCVSVLAQEYEVSDRTIRRDFEVIRDIFGDFVAKEGECYRAFKRVLLDKVLNASDLMTLANIVNLFDTIRKSSQISESTKALIKRAESVYDFKTRPFEKLTNFDTLSKLEHAIKFRKEVKIGYKTQEKTFYAKLQPYKIIFLNENFYIVGLYATRHKFEYRRVSMIVSVEFTGKTFTKDASVVEFINRLQSPWANYDGDEIEIKLKAHKSIARYFKRKKYLASQKVLQEFEDGSVEVSYRVTNFREVEDIVLKWLPKIEILEPKNFKKMIKKSLKKKFKAL